MMNEADERHGQSLRDELSRTRRDLETTADALKAVDERFEALEATRERFVHLETVCTTLEKLDDLDAADLFWRASTPEISRWL